jgi:hypothetical protein
MLLLQSSGTIGLDNGGFATSGPRRGTESIVWILEVTASTARSSLGPTLNQDLFRAKQIMSSFTVKDALTQSDKRGGLLSCTPFFVNFHRFHGGSSGRFDRIRERDRNYAFMLTELGIME